MTEVIYKPTTREDKVKLEKTIREILVHQYKMKNYYFWKAPKTETERVKYNKDNSRYFHFVYENQDVILKAKTFCSGDRIFFKMEYIINNKTVTHREITKLFWKIREELGMENAYMRKGEVIRFDKENPLPYY